MFKSYKKLYKIEKENNKNMFLVCSMKDKKIAELEKELQEAKNLKEILDRMSGITINGLSYGATGGSWNIEHQFPDTVLQYTDDILGGKVIKQEGTKCLVIEKDGTIKTGLTKQKADKGYSYKLVRM